MSDNRLRFPVRVWLASLVLPRRGNDGLTLPERTHLARRYAKNFTAPKMATQEALERSKRAHPSNAAHKSGLDVHMANNVYTPDYDKDRLSAVDTERRDRLRGHQNESVNDG